MSIDNPAIAEWQAALAAYSAAADAQDAYDRDVLTPTNMALDAILAALGPVRETDAVGRAMEEAGARTAQARFDELVDDKHASLGKLLLTPAPDLAAVAWKLDNFNDAAFYYDNNVVDIIGAIADDVRRLSANLSTIAESVGLLAASCPAPAWARAIGRQAERIEEGIAAH